MNESWNIRTIEGGCPFCGDDIKGNDNLQYFCKSCVMFFKKGHVEGKIFKENTEEKYYKDT